MTAPDRIKTDAIEEAIREHWGERCKTRDVEDFPDLVAQPNFGRCACCVAWDQFDALTVRADLVAELVEALEFYADRQYNGYDIEVTDYGLSINGGPIIKDGGDKARAALARYRGGV